MGNARSVYRKIRFLRNSCAEIMFSKYATKLRAWHELSGRCLFALPSDAAALYGMTCFSGNTQPTGVTEILMFVESS